MKRSWMGFGWILGLLLCAALVAIPLRAAEEQRSPSGKDSAEPQQASKQSDLVRAANAHKKKAASTTYTNDDLEKGDGSSLTFTNEDLSRMFGAAPEDSSAGDPASSGSSPGSGSSSADSPPDPLTAMKDQQEAQATREQRIEEAESRLATAEAKLKNLEVQLLATRNPFSARPQLSAEEKTERAESNETAAQRNARTQELVDAAQAEVAEAADALAQAKSE